MPHRQRSKRMSCWLSHLLIMCGSPATGRGNTTMGINGWRAIGNCRRDRVLCGSPRAGNSKAMPTGITRAIGLEPAASGFQSRPWIKITISQEPRQRGSFFYLNPQPRSPKSKRSHQRRGLRTWPNRIQLLINMNAAGDSVNALITHGSWILLRLLFDYHISKLKVNVRLARQSAATSACLPPRIQRAFPNSPIKSSTTQFARAACNLSAAAPCCQTA